MNSIADRIGTLEMRVERLETWAGPGQSEALSVSIRAIRADLIGIRRTQKQHGVQLVQHGVQLATLTADVARLQDDVSVLKADVAVLKADVAVLKADVAEVKVVLQEILLRLPPLPAG
jgi:chromosome segregation ATPase